MSSYKREITQYARTLGYEVEEARNNHLKFIRPGSPIVFGPGTPSDHRSISNVKAKLKREAKLAEAA